MDNVAGLPNRGQTYHGGTPSATIAQSAGIEGHEKAFTDMVAGTAGAIDTRRSDRKVYCRLVRNTAGVNLLPKLAVKYETNYWGKRVDGYTRLTNDDCAGIVDPLLPAAGVADDDLFWLVVKGPCLCTTGTGADQLNVITEGSAVVAVTAATSQASATAGRVVLQKLTGATEVLGKAVQNRIGRAMSAKTTANTDVDILIDVDIL